MPRQVRFVLPGVPQHITHRGNNQGKIFFKNIDYSYYLKWLKQASEKYRCHIHAYVLMTNHVHLLVTPLEYNSISKTLQSLGTRYVQHVNYRYGRTGTLWEGRYRAAHVDSNHYLFACYRYIEMNPVRAGMVNNPGDYNWSSYGYHGQGKTNPLIRDHPLFLGLGRTPVERQWNYNAMFETPLDQKTINSIREATNTSQTLGSDSFKKKLEMLKKTKTEGSDPNRV